MIDLISGVTVTSSTADIKLNYMLYCYIVIEYITIRVNCVVLFGVLHI